ncbi:uncharacterized protein Bfra_011592, partial [Botrytis fragariae]
QNEPDHVLAQSWIDLRATSAVKEFLQGELWASEHTAHDLCQSRPSQEAKFALCIINSSRDLNYLPVSIDDYTFLGGTIDFSLDYCHLFAMISYSDALDNLRKAALGGSRTYQSLVQHRSRHAITTAKLRLSYLSTYAPILFHKFNNGLDTPCGPILVIFVFRSISLNTMQVAIASDQMIQVQTRYLWSYLWGLSLIALIFSSLLALGLVFAEEQRCRKSKIDTTDGVVNFPDGTDTHVELRENMDYVMLDLYLWTFDLHA